LNLRLPPVVVGVGEEAALSLPLPLAQDRVACADPL